MATGVMGLGARAGGVEVDDVERGRSRTGGASDALYSLGAYVYESFSSPTWAQVWNALTVRTPTFVLYLGFLFFVIGFSVLSKVKVEDDDGNEKLMAPKAIMVVPIFSILMFIFVLASLWRRDGYVRHGLPLPKASKRRVVEEEETREEEDPDFF